jgi:hypothetical protein
MESSVFVNDSIPKPEMYFKNGIQYGPTSTSTVLRITVFATSSPTYRTKYLCLRFAPPSLVPDPAARYTFRRFLLMQALTWNKALEIVDPGGDLVTTATPSSYFIARANSPEATP